MCQAKITPASIRSQGPISVFENANNEGMVEIHFSPEEVAHLYKRKISMEDMINHLFHKAFSGHVFILHRIILDNKHYRKCTASVFWNEDGSLYFAFNVLQLIGLPGASTSFDKDGILTVFNNFKRLCEKFPEMNLSLVFSGISITVRYTYTPADDEAYESEVQSFYANCFPKESFANKLAESIGDDRFGEIPHIIDESFLFPILGRPHINYMIASRS